MKANPAPAPLTRKRSALVIREPPVSSALTSIEEVGLGEEEDKEPSLLRKNSKLARLEATPEAVTVQPSTDTTPRDDHTSMVTQLIPNPVPPSLAENVSTSELPTATASSSHELVLVTDMGIPFTPSPSPPLSESSPATTVEPHQVSVPSSVVPTDPMPSSSAVPAPLAPPEDDIIVPAFSKIELTTALYDVCWEGSTADSRVLKDAVARPNGLKVPNGDYYLCDCGYTNGEGFLAPYRGVRYHMQEWDA
ncbi:hypothetical protein BUALT_Bualt07G0055100 [Buddleja alternifolia]|uniref:DDE Tnp4 domain-containing protein n=1 Tax=Buddleja alternifolia TaxID=168488 RepID=A0AAV6XJ15_9LAMI|nr:hypothetical protein BUALT_Bualt07G0055100 [Buddleja alternifolia]